MRKRSLVLVASGALLAGVAIPAVASAHSAPPCNDTDGDGSPSGHEYAMHHIVPLAKAGELGHTHKPGSHMGFSLCLDVHDGD